MLWTFMSLQLLCDWFIFFLHQFSHAAHFGCCLYTRVNFHLFSRCAHFSVTPSGAVVVAVFILFISTFFSSARFCVPPRPFPLFHPCLVLKSSTFMWCFCTVCSPAWFWSLFRCCDSPECCALRTYTYKSHDFIKLLPFLYLTYCVRFILVVVVFFVCFCLCFCCCCLNHHYFSF